MNLNNKISSTATVSIPWYKVPIMWFMVVMLSLTVISGIYMFVLAAGTPDTIVTEKNHIPLNKKQANPSSSSDSAVIKDKTL